MTDAGLGSGIRQNMEIGRLVEELALLKERLDNITERVASLETLESSSSQKAEILFPEVEEEVWSEGEGWSGGNALLPRLATICFMLVFALILRTVTDNDILPFRLGSMIGLGYAFSLIFIGWNMYAKHRRVAPVFPICGILLLFSIVLEVHSRFVMLSTLSAHSVLFLGMLVTAMVGLRYKAPWLLAIGTIGSGLVGLSLNFPSPMFPATGFLVLAAIFIAFLAAGREVSRLLRWGVLLLVLLFWLLWGFKMRIPLGQGLEPGALFFGGWYFPFLFIHFSTYFILGAIQVKLVKGAVGVFRAMLPSINAIWACAAGISVAVPWLCSGRLAGFFVAMLALGHFALAAFYARRGEIWQASTNAFVLAGVILLGIGLPFAAGGVVYALPFWSVGGVLLAFLSARWESGGIRVTSYLFQLFASGAAIVSGYFAVGALPPAIGIPLSLLLSAMAMYQYQWCRANNPPREGSAYFSWLDTSDASAVVLLVAGLVGGFAAFRLGLYLILTAILLDPADSYRCGQTVLLNIGAAALLFWALRSRRGEIIAIALIVGLLGALKVFLYDMFTTEGVPLVLSVFSFGVLAALGSVASSRWQQRLDVGEEESIEAVG